MFMLLGMVENIPLGLAKIVHTESPILMFLIMKVNLQSHRASNKNMRKSKKMKHGKDSPVGSQTHPRKVGSHSEANIA